MFLVLALRHFHGTYFWWLLMWGSVELAFRKTDSIVNSRWALFKSRLFWRCFFIIISHNTLDEQLINNIAFPVFSKQSDQLIVLLLKIINFLHGMFILSLESFDLTLVEIFLFELKFRNFSVNPFLLDLQYISHSFKQLSHIIVNLLQDHCYCLIKMIEISYHLSEAHVDQPITTSYDAAICLAGGLCTAQVRWQVGHYNVDCLVKICHQLLVHHVLWLFVNLSNVVIYLSDLLEVTFL